MVEGFMYGDRYTIKWMPRDEPLFLGVFARNSMEMQYGTKDLFSRPKVLSHYCEGCEKMVVDVGEHKKR